VVVQSIKLDTLFNKGLINSCDFLKIDVEGAEKFVLEGAQLLLSSERPVILAEILRKWSLAQGYKANDVLAMLNSLDYKCYSIGEEINEIQEISEGLQETNFLFFNLRNSVHRKILNKIGVNP
jgi:hypothetical protein